MLMGRASRRLRAVHCQSAALAIDRHRKPRDCRCLPPAAHVLEFFQKALPILVAIKFVAALLPWAGALDIAARGLAPVMALFNLPADSVRPTILTSE